MYKIFLFNLLGVVFILFTVLIFKGCASDSPTLYDSYDPLIWKARLAFKEGNNIEALAKFQEALEILPYENQSDLFTAAETALKLGKNDLAKTFIRTAFVRYNPDSTVYVSFFAPFKGEEIFDEIQAERPELLKEYYTNLPYPKQVLDDIEEIRKRDQNVRKPENQHRMKEVDSVNIRQLMEITREYGWIDKAWIVLWHQRGTYGTDNEVWSYFKPFIDSEIKKGNVRKSFWAMYEDHEQIIKSREQIYGMFASNYDMMPVVNVKQVDKRRADIGLPPLWYMNKVFDRELPEGYTATNDDFLKSL